MDEETPHLKTSEYAKKGEPYKIIIVWKAALFEGIVHILTLAAFILPSSSTYLWTFIFAIFGGVVCSQGMTSGAHRLWCHRSYKAKLPLRIFLMLLNCASLQDDIYSWCRDHRVHHKYSDTNADPYNSRRGFFFSHMGWLMCKKHPDVKEMGKKVDCSDILADPVVRFQRRFYVPLVVIFCFLVPSFIPWYFWGERFLDAFLIAGMFRYCLISHSAWLVNSAAHIYGNRPYNKHIEPRQNLLVSFFAMGEGFHNYHHTFPWDYSTSEFGWKKLNVSTFFIDAMALLGQAYDLKRVSPEMVKKRIITSGEKNE